MKTLFQEKCELCRNNDALKFLPVVLKPSGFLKIYASCMSCYGRYVTDEALEREFSASL